VPSPQWVRPDPPSSATASLTPAEARRSQPASAGLAAWTHLGYLRWQHARPPDISVESASVTLTASLNHLSELAYISRPSEHLRIVDRRAIPSIARIPPGPRSRLHRHQTRDQARHHDI